ncbi:DUF4294 domain-containing protein [Flavilitoribacter nigricans]|uniref:DUF4294 domain-containing protein n=1 Tax=Flavilitoribacter nigricans (strain ATCC 23147 / DSM 23189 / NBRC 102662 / NCIMB 1420 / SS-2) TaxID=1122177 RepID=A0A2D0N034_FLAN2|nr:DUF4294 domain-containing protein [Flavilitoribacter nigricans]PHN01736.1 hypothetical protein CRP01_35925 [Flavilitoribacter nigricans DSM 23189 = NBRC 102662]
MKAGYLFFFFCLTALGLSAQNNTGYTRVGERYFPYTIDECGDTLILASLDDVTVSTPRSFNSDEEYRRFRRYRRYALKVYPYAVEAIRIFRELENETEDMKKRARKKHIRDLQKEMKDKFSDPLKDLTKTQGMILIKMIEKELDTPMYFLIKDLRSGLTATYWKLIGGLYGHDLKEGYIEGQDPVLDAVLNDLDVSYDAPPPSMDDDDLEEEQEK